MRITDQHPYERHPNKIQFNTLGYFVYSTIIRDDIIMTAGKKGIFTFDLPSLKQHCNIQYQGNVNCCVPVNQSSSLILKDDNSISVYDNNTQRNNVLFYGGLYYNRQILPVDQQTYLISSRGEKHCLVRFGQGEQSIKIIAGIGQGHQKLIYRGCLLDSKLVTCSTDLTVKIADINTLDLERSIRMEHKPYTLIKIDNNQVVIGGSDTKLKLYDLRIKRFSMLIETMKPQTYCGLSIANNKLLVSHGTTICQYDLRGMDPLAITLPSCGRVWNIHEWKDRLIMSGNNFITICP